LGGRWDGGCLYDKMAVDKLDKMYIFDPIFELGDSRSDVKQ
jgi:hypothetical protein